MFGELWIFLFHLQQWACGVNKEGVHVMGVRVKQGMALGVLAYDRVLLCTFLLLAIR